MVDFGADRSKGFEAAHSPSEVKIYRNLDISADFEPLQFEVPVVWLTGCVSRR